VGRPARPPFRESLVAVLTGAAGVLAISQPHFDHASLTLAIGILSAIVHSRRDARLNKLSDVEPRRIVLHFAMVSTLIMGAVYFMTARTSPIGAFSDPLALAMLLGMGLLGTVGQIARD